jgi:trehalose 6-phosphate phosphatase
MHIEPTPEAPRGNRAGPSSKLPQPQTDWAWFFDLDGTLVDIASSPSAVAVPEGLVSTLIALRLASHGALAVLSGRPAQNVRSLLEPLRPAAAGLHGLEIVRPDGLRQSARKPLPPVGGLRKMLQDNVVSIPGVEFENKGAALAIHFRQASQSEGMIRDLVSAAVEKNRGFEVMEGKMVLEVRPQGFHKGTALREFMAMEPFIGRVPVVIGDDQTDEDAFAEAQSMGGITVHVGPELHTAAQWTIESPVALRLWLAEAAESLKRQRM